MCRLCAHLLFCPPLPVAVNVFYPQSVGRPIYLAFGSQASLIQLYYPPRLARKVLIRASARELFSGFAFMDTAGRIFAPYLETNGRMPVYAAPYTMMPFELQIPRGFGTTAMAERGFTLAIAGTGLRATGLSNSILTFTLASGVFRSGQKVRLPNGTSTTSVAIDNDQRLIALVCCSAVNQSNLQVYAAPTPCRPCCKSL